MGSCPVPFFLFNDFSRKVWLPPAIEGGSPLFFSRSSDYGGVPPPHGPPLRRSFSPGGLPPFFWAGWSGLWDFRPSPAYTLFLLQFSFLREIPLFSPRRVFWGFLFLWGVPSSLWLGAFSSPSPILSGRLFFFLPTLHFSWAAIFVGEELMLSSFSFFPLSPLLLFSFLPPSIQIPPCLTFPLKQPRPVIPRREIVFFSPPAEHDPFFPDSELSVAAQGVFPVASLSVVPQKRFSSSSEELALSTYRRIFEPFFFFSS